MQSPPPQSTIDPSIPRLTPPVTHTTEPPPSAHLIEALALQAHVEGGYFVELDRDPRTVPNPFLLPSSSSSSPTANNNADKTAPAPFSGNNAVRNASTSIFYLLTPKSPVGRFHRNRGRTVHTVVRGRGRYIIIHADEEGDKKKKKRVETFVVGNNVEAGEKAVWIVEGDKYKASILVEGDREEGGLLISETVVPGFEYSDHDFLPKEKLHELVTEDQAAELEWLVRDAPKPDGSEL